MLLTAHQPNYLPYPGFFQKIAGADEFLIVDTTQFVKRGPFGWIHRNRIRTPNGTQWLSLPVLTKGKYEQRICDSKLNPREDWATKHWRTIEFNYKNAPFWSNYGPGLERIYKETSTESLSEFTSAIISWFLEALDLNKPVHTASELDASGRSTDYIIEFCRELGATEFLSGVHGRDYLDLEAFEASGVDLRFQSYTPPSYEADGRGSVGEFENLTMLDALVWWGDAAVEWVHAVPDCAPA